VQLVLRSEEMGRPVRRYAGLVTGAAVEVGDQVLVLPQGTHSMVAGIDVGGVPVDAAGPGLAVALRLTDDVDVARGDVIASALEPPSVVRDLDATVFWFAGRPFAVGDRSLVKLATRTERVVVLEVQGRLDLGSLEVAPAAGLQANEIGRVRLAAAGPLVVDSYDHNRSTGSLLLIDPATNATVGAGIIA
jgi:sulfate adenylyltransferase subunit 1